MTISANPSKFHIVSINTAVKSVLNDSYRHQKKLDAELGDSLLGFRRFENHIHSEHNLEQALAGASKLLDDYFDYSNLPPKVHSIFRELHKACPQAEHRKESEGFSEEVRYEFEFFYRMAVENENLRDYYSPQPEIETWLAEKAQELAESIPTGFMGSKEFFPLFLGIQILATEKLGEILKEHLKLPRDTQETIMSLSSGFASMLKSSFLCTFVKDFHKHNQLDTENFLKEAAAFSKLHIRGDCTKIPDRTNSPFYSYGKAIQICIKQLAGLQKEIDGIRFETLASKKHFPAMAQRLGNSFPEPFVQKKNPILPPGRIILINKTGDDISYYCSSPKDACRVIGHSCPKEDQIVSSFSDPFISETATFGWNNSQTASIDKNGKLCLPGRFRFMPEPSDEPALLRTRALVNNAASHFNQQMVDTWIEYSDLFARLHELGMVAILKEGEKTFLVCHHSMQNRISELIPTAAQLSEEETETLETDFSIFTRDNWPAFSLTSDHSNTATTDNEQLSKTEEPALKALQEKLCGHPTDFRKVKKWMTHLGAKWDPVRGSGSHGMLIRSTPAGDLASVISHKHQSTGMHGNIVLSTMHRLGFSAEELLDVIDNG